MENNDKLLSSDYLTTGEAKHAIRKPNPDSVMPKLIEEISTRRLINSPQASYVRLVKGYNLNEIKSDQSQINMLINALVSTGQFKRKQALDLINETLES